MKKECIICGEDRFLNMKVCYDCFIEFIGHKSRDDRYPTASTVTFSDYDDFHTTHDCYRRILKNLERFG